MRISDVQLTGRFLDTLWQAFLRRVPCTQLFLQKVNELGGEWVTDHLAFRTLNYPTGEQPAGITAISHLLKNLHYSRAGSYTFGKQKLSAVYFEHRNTNFPKVFVSQLEVGELPAWAQQLIGEVVFDTPYLLSDHAIELLNYLEADGNITAEAAEILIHELAGYFRRPWRMPSKETMLKINDVSQYAAWVLLHGNSVSHYSALYSKDLVSAWPDLETAVEDLIRAGIPLKREIAGEKNSSIRQAATVPVKETYRFPLSEGDFDEMPWTYAYFQLTERGYHGEGTDRTLFPGFLQERASKWFNNTLTREN